MTQPPQPPPQATYPGWYWDAAMQQWAPASEQQQYAAEFQQRQATYAAAPTIRGATLGMHFKRAIDWNVSDVVLSTREQRRLDAAGVVEPRLQALMAWRRSTLLVALPILILGTILSFVDAAGKDTVRTGPRTDLGKLALFLPPISLLLVPLGALIVISRWTELRRSSRLLIACWAVSIVVPLLVALLPIDAIIDTDAVRAAGSQVGVDPTTGIFGARMLLAVNYALTLLPVIVTVPGGVLKGAGRVKFLFPAAALPGWFLMTVAPSTRSS
jgi:hypothetical protein